MRSSWRSIGHVVLAAAGLLLAGTVLRATQAPLQTSSAPTDQAIIFFETRIRPLLAANCQSCHGDSAMAGLRVDSREGMLRGGETGPAIVPGDPDKSTLIKAVQHADGFPRMPRGRAKLATQDIDALAQWIRDGAAWPAAAAAAPAPAVAHERPITAEQRAYWAFRPLDKPVAPEVRRADWPRTDIDRFVLARLEREGLGPVGPADKLTLLRRATLDLTGLPPSPDDVDAFLKDQSPDAFGKVIDRLLESPQYGEAWGRLWLDVARYAEDDYRSLDPMGRGFNPYPNAHLYRDWVVRAFNDDLPYDQFVTAQLAADLLDGPARLRHLPALGFLGLGPWYYDNGAVEIMRADERHDRVDAVTRGMLGLTVGCARCHDHKYDPIPTKDYYSLAGVFLNTEYHEYPLAPKAIVTAQKAQEDALDQKREMLREYTNTEAMQLAGTLAFQSVRYMKAAWQVTGEPKKEKSEIIEKEKLDYELFDRWLAFLQRKPTFYPYLKDWQAMIAKGGTAKEAETLAGAFQDEIISVLLEERELKKENDIIKAQALPTSKPKKPSNKPNEFKTNDDFCPGCGLELRSMTKERVSLFRDVFVVNLETDSFVPGQEPKPGLLRFRGLGPRTASRRRSPHADREPAQGHRSRSEEARERLRLRARRPRHRKAGRPAGSPARQSAAARRCRAPRFPLGAEPRGKDHVLQRLGPPRTGARYLHASVGHARHRQSRVEGTFRDGNRRYAEQLWPERRTADQSRIARSPRERVCRQRHVDQSAPPRNHAERGLSTERRSARPRRSRKTPATGCTGARRAAVSMPSRSAMRY